MRRITPDSVPKGAYVTGPFTLAGLMMGAESIAMNTMMEPDLVRRTLEVATSVVTRYALALEDAGAKIIIILDPTAVILGPKQFESFAGHYVRILAASLKSCSTVYHVCGDTTHLMDVFGTLGVDGVSLDSVVDMPAIAQRVADDMVLIGNVNPVTIMLQSKPKAVYEAVLASRQAMGNRRAYIISTGCDLPMETPFENIEAFMAAARAPLNDS